MLPTRHLLVVEANPIDRFYASRVLENCGHKVTTAATGKEALAALNNQTFDLVLTCISLADIDGVTLTKAIRNGEAKANSPGIPVVILTAYALEEFKVRCSAAGANAFLTKPVEMADLVDTVSRLLPVLVPPASGLGRLSVLPALVGR